MSNHFAIGDRVRLKVDYNTTFHKLTRGMRGTVIAMDTLSCYVELDKGNARLIIPKNKLEVLK